MTVERKPVAFGDQRAWIRHFARRRRAARGDRRSRLEHRARHDHAHGAGDRRRTCAPLQQHQGLQQEGCARLEGVRLLAVELSAHRDDARASAGDASARAGEGRAHDPERRDPAQDRQDRPGEGEHHHRRRHQPARFPGAALEPHRRRPLHDDLCGLRDEEPRHERDECRRLSRHGRRPQSHPDLHVSRAAYRPSRARLAAEGREGDADRLCDRLGAVDGFLLRLAGADGRVRIRRDGLDPRRAGRARQMREPRSLRAGDGRDRRRRVSAVRSVDLHAGRARSRNSPAMSRASARSGRPCA